MIIAILDIRSCLEDHQAKVIHESVLGREAELSSPGNWLFHS